MFDTEEDTMISTKGRYAIRVMIDLAEHDNGSYIPLKDIAGGLLVGASGKGGGYKLCRKPEEYPVGEILELMEGNLNSVACIAHPEYNCPRRSSCQTLPLWTEFDNLVHDFFYGKKLSDLISENPDNKKAGN